MDAAEPKLPWYSFRWKTIRWIFFWTLLPYSLIVLIVATRRWPRFSLRTMFVATTAAAIMLTYFGSYYRLSRRGMQEANARGSPSFLYIPFDEAAATHDLTEHRRVAVLFAPLNVLDRKLFKATGPVGSITWIRNDADQTN